MKKQEVIDYLKGLNIEELGEVLIESGAFRNSEVSKYEVEDSLNCELYYDEYENVEYCDIFVFPRPNEFAIVDTHFFNKELVETE
jgi:hypothetical protein